MVQRGIGDEWQVVELQDIEMLGGARRQAQLSDALVGDELAVREADGFQPRTAGAEDAKGVVCDEDALFQVHFLQQVAISG